MADYRDLELSTERLLLRPLRDRDAPALFDIHADPEFARYWSSAPWTELAQAEQLIRQDQLDLERGEHVRLGLQRREDEALLGTCTLFKIHAGNRRAEIGYGLAPRHWGQGYANEAVGELLDWGFGPLALHRVEADIDPENLASAKLLQRLGFRLEGRLRERWIVAGQVSDSAIYGLLAREWRELRGKASG